MPALQTPKSPQEERVMMVCRTKAKKASTVGGHAQHARLLHPALMGCKTKARRASTVADPARSARRPRAKTTFKMGTKGVDCGGPCVIVSTLAGEYGDTLECLVAGEAAKAYFTDESGFRVAPEDVMAGGSIRLGRCGVGCNWFDDDDMQDCMDHDQCLEHYSTAGCADEWVNAADDYVVTYGAWCDN